MSRASVNAETSLLYDPLICHHEAAHAVTAWFLGFDVAQVQLLSRERFHRRDWLRNKSGRQLVGALGHTEYRRQAFGGRDVVARNGASQLVPYCKQRLAVVLAGPVMTAILTEQSLNHALLHGGLDDRKAASQVRALANFGRKTTSGVIEGTARFLMSRAGAKAVSQVAGRLVYFGRVSGDQLEMLCRQAFRLGCDADPRGTHGPQRLHDSQLPLLWQLGRGAGVPLASVA